MGYHTVWNCTTCLLLVSCQLRTNMLHCREWLSRHAEQFRAIQKRLLTRFKDKTPVGLANLDTLLDGTYMQVNHQLLKVK